MQANRSVRLRVFRIAVLLAIVLSLFCLIVPNEAISRADLLGLGQSLGASTAEAAGVAPVTVDNSTSDMAVMSPTQRKLFYAAGRFWLFYSDGADLVYKSSSDGLSWSAKSASLGTMASGDGLSAYFDGTYVHYARSTGTKDEPLYYRRGVPIADGTIAWSAAEQVAVAGVTGVHYLHPSVSVDSSGHALISYHYEKQSGLAGEGPCITKSGNADGTWGSVPAGFPYELTSASESEWYTTVHGLTADKIAVTFADHTNIKGVSVRTYDGANWNSVQTTASDLQFGNGYSAVAEGDDVHIALLKTDTFDVLYCKYTYATNTLGSEYTLLTSATASSRPSLASDSNNDLYCFWSGAPMASHIYYMRMISGVWDAGCTDWLTETDLTANGGVSAFYDQGGSDCIGVAWETGAASPYDVRFAAVDTGVAPNQVPNQPANVSPAEAATGLSLTPTLQSSAFSDPDTGDTHGASQWQVRATLGDYSNPVFDSLTDNVNLISILVPAEKLGYSATYYWHVRHQDNHGDWSDWSAETSFSTIPAPNQPPNQPGNVSPADEAAGISLTPTLQSSGFSDPDAGDTHGASQWQITATSGDYSSPAFDGQIDNTNLVSIPIPTGKLGYSTTYYWHVRYQDNHGDWSSWSAETSFTTIPAPNQPPNQPGNASPAVESTGISLTPTLQSSGFSDPDTGDNHGASQWQITGISGDYASPVFDSQIDNTNLLSTLVPAGKLGYSTTYYWHVRYQDNHGDWSPWSAETSFATMSAPNQIPNQPGNVSPANGATGISLTPTLRASDFSDPDTGDTHVASQWQITATSGDYASPIFDSQTDNTNLVSTLVPAGKLGYSATCYWHVRYQDNHGDWSPWSAETLFATAAAPNQPPDQPDNGDTGLGLPDPDQDGGTLPYLVAIGTAIAAVAMVGATFYLAHARLMRKPKGLRSAHTISRRLRK